MWIINVPGCCDSLPVWVAGARTGNYSADPGTVLTHVTLIFVRFPNRFHLFCVSCATNSVLAEKTAFACRHSIDVRCGSRRTLALIFKDYY